MKNKSNTEKIHKGALKNPWFYVSAIAVVIIIVMAYNIMSPSVNNKNLINDRESQQQVPTQQTIIEVSEDDDAVLGNPDAQITIIEFSDYECPFCLRFYLNSLPQLKSEYIDTGKVKLIYRDFPLNFHQDAQKAAEAAECAGEQGKYYVMHDKIFENQQAITVNDLKKYAGEIGLNTNEFNECLDSGEMANEVKKDSQDGQKAGVQGTPTFFINGKLLVGAQPFEAFKQVIDEELQ